MDAKDRAYLDEVWDLTFRAIGRVVVASGWLEQSLRELYGRLLDSPAAAVIVPGMNFELTRDSIKAVLTVVEHDDSEAIADVLAEAKKLWDDRNSTVHAGAWYGGHVTGPGVVHAPASARRHMTTMSKRGKIAPLSREWTAGEIDDLANQINKIRARIEQLAVSPDRLEDEDSQTR
jgi:hypothetical protein